MSAVATRRQALLLRSAAVALADHRLVRAAADGLGRRVLVQRLPGGPVDGGGRILRCCVFMLFGWFGTVIGESEGHLYNKKVDLSFRWSMSWFIFSEVMFFAAFFGALFYIRNLSVPDLGSLGRQAHLAGLRGAVADQRPVRHGAVHADGARSASRCSTRSSC